MVASLEVQNIPSRIASNPQDFIDNPDLLANWIYKVSLQIDSLSSNIETTAVSGDIKILGSNALVPSGTLLCDGATYNVVDFPDLYKALEPTGVASTFDVPDLQAFIIDNTAGVIFSLDTAIKSPFTVVIQT